MNFAGGLPAIAYVERDEALAFVRAQDSSGSAWSAPVIVHSRVEGDLQFTMGNITLGARDSKPAIVCQNSVGVFYVEALDSDGLSWGEPEFAALEGTGTDDVSAFISNSGLVIAYTTTIEDSSELRIAFKE
jgi:hypothetical protein